MIYQGEAAYDIAHDVLYDMLLCIDEICKRHAIPYQLAAGSLLGAVRERDFIKWDKDADVCMLRADFSRFMRVAENELPDKYFLQHDKSDPLFFSLVTKLRLDKSRRIFLSSKFAPNVHDGIALDIFPFDDVKPNTLFGRVHMFCSSLIKPLLVLRYVGDSGMLWQNNRGALVKLAASFCYQPIRLIPKRLLQNVALWVTTFYSRQGPLPHVTCLVSMPFKAKKRLPRIRQRTDFTNTVGVTLRGHTFPAPHNYHQILVALYGDNYMQPPTKAEQALVMQIELDTNR